MPMLYSLGQHRALEAIHSSFQPTETLMAFLDDVYAVTPSPDRVGGILGSIQENMWVHSSIRIDGGKTQVWNAAGRKPAICEVSDRVAQAADPAAKVWKGSEVPPNQQGLKILGAPFGHPEFVAAQLEKSFQKQETLIRRIPLVPDLQAAWLILLHCASARANYLLRVVDPEQVQQFAQMHDQRLWQCLCQLLGIAPDLCDDVARSSTTLPLVLGGLGLRSASRTRMAGFWASWADCLPMINARHPEVAARIIAQLEGDPSGQSVQSAAESAHSVVLNPPVGGHWPPVCGLPTTRNRRSRDGNMKRPPGSNKNIGNLCSECWLNRRGRRSGLMEVREQGLHSRLVQHVLSLASTLHSSACYCCVVFVSLCRCPPATAGVAVHSILVVITEQLALGQVSWEEEVSRWRAQLRGSVAKEEHESPPTSWSGMWTWRLQILEMRDGWRSSLMGCHCSEAHSWRSTRP